jgi:hypothetical protein
MRRCLRVPDFRQILAQGKYLLPVRSRCSNRVTSSPLLILAIEFFNRLEFGFPILLQIPCDQSIFRLHRLVLTLRSLGFVMGSFQPQFPLSLKAGLFFFQLLKRFQRDADFVTKSRYRSANTSQRVAPSGRARAFRRWPGRCNTAPSPPLRAHRRCARCLWLSYIACVRQIRNSRR